MHEIVIFSIVNLFNLSNFILQIQKKDRVAAELSSWIKKQINFEDFSWK
jgi:hypothetical protein